MSIELNNPEPIDPSDPKYHPLLKNLQGNILKGHGRDHTVNVFIEFCAEPYRVRERLKRLAARVVTSAYRQFVESAQYKEFGIPGGIFGNLFLSANGYRALGFSEDQLRGAFPERPGDFGVQSNFREGMRAHAAELNDPDPSTWEPGFRDARIDAMILLADDDAGYLLREARALFAEIDEFARVVAVERGDALRNEAGEGIEHFGYVDGRSQPVFFSTDMPAEGGTDNWNPAEPLGLVLVPDAGAPTADAFGSYLVFRKLEQDVLHFKLREQDLADELGLDGSERARAGALAVGRFQDGTPVVLSQADGFIPKQENNFSFGIDPDGLKCPFHAHIRKSNPRGDIVRKLAPQLDERTAERPRRIARRGITYGSRSRHPGEFQSIEDLPAGGVGLLFMCFQASIANQFAFIQSRWVNEEGFVIPGTGQDPVIAQSLAGGPGPIPQNWPTQWGHPGTKPFRFGSFVTMKGGEFFFAPSIPFLQILAPPSECRGAD